MPPSPNSPARALALATLLALACHPALEPRELADEVAAATRAAVPGATIERVDDLTLRVVAPGNHQADVRLDNAFAAARNDPGSREQVVRDVVASIVEAMSLAAVDPSRIVPVVRERAFVEAMGEAAPVWEPLGGSLVVAYVEDLESGMRYLAEGDLAAAGVDRGSLRLLACGNLRRLLPAAIEIHDLDRAFMVTAGGSYESSLLLLDELWNPERFPVAGDFVVAVPTRDLLLVTGSGERRGLAKVRRSAGIASRRGDHPISKQLFVRRGDGRLATFVDPSA